MEDARARISRLDLPLPLEPLIFGALIAGDDVTRRDRVDRAWRLAVEMVALTFWVADVNDAARKSLIEAWREAFTQSHLASWTRLIELSLQEFAKTTHPEALAFLVDQLQSQWESSSEISAAFVSIQGNAGCAIQSPVALLQAVASTYARQSTDDVLEALIVFLERVPLMSGGSVLVVDSVRRSIDRWQIDSTRMHGPAPQLDQREVECAVEPIQGRAYWVSSSGTLFDLDGVVASEMTPVTVRLGWIEGPYDFASARYATHLSGDLIEALDPAMYATLFGDAPRIDHQGEGVLGLSSMAPHGDLARTGSRRRTSRAQRIALVALAVFGLVASAGWSRSWLMQRRAHQREVVERDARTRAERLARSEHEARVLVELQLHAASGSQGITVGANTPSPTPPRMSPEAAEASARALILSTQAGHEAEALAAAIHVTGQALAQGLSPAEQSIDALALAIAAARHSFSISGRHDGTWSSEVSSDGHRMAVADTDGHVRIWDTQRRHVISSLGHDAEDVVSAQFSPDNSRFLTFASTGQIKLWDVHDGRLVTAFDPTTRDAHFGASGARITTASTDGVARVWNAHSGESISVLRGHEGSVDLVMLSPDESRVLTTGDDGTIRVWSVASSDELQRFDAGINDITAATFSPDGTRVVTTGLTRNETSARAMEAAAAHVAAMSNNNVAPVHRVPHRVQLWDVVNGHAIANLDETSAHHPMEFSRDGSHLAIATLESGVTLWDTHSGTRVGTLPVDCAHLATLSFSPDGTHVLTTDETDTRLWDAATGVEQHRIDVRINADDGLTMFSPDGTAIFAAGTNTGEGLYNVETGERDLLLRGNAGGVVNAMFHPSGDRLLTVGRDAVTRIWDMETGELIEAMGAHTEPISAARFTGDGSHALSAGRDGVIRLWDENAGQSLLSFHHTIVEFGPDATHAFTTNGNGAPRIIELPSGSTTRVFTGFTGGVRIAGFSPDFSTITLVDRRGAVSIWDPHSGELIRSIASAVDHGEVRPALSGDAMTLLLARPDGRAQVWDLRSGTQTGQYQGELYQATSFVLSRDGHRMLVQGPDGHVQLRDVENGVTVARIGTDDNDIVGMTFSPDGSRVATVSPDGPTVLWDGVSGRSLTSLDEFGTVVRFSPDGARLAIGVDGEGRGAAAGTTRGMIRVWDVQSSRIVSSLDGHAGAVTSIAFSSDGSQIVTTSDDHTARIWTTAGGQLIATLLGHNEEVASAGFSLGAEWVRTSSGDGTIRVFPATARGFLSMACGLVRSGPARQYCGGGTSTHHSHHASASLQP